MIDRTDNARTFRLARFLVASLAVFLACMVGAPDATGTSAVRLAIQDRDTATSFVLPAIEHGKRPQGKVGSLPSGDTPDIAAGPAGQPRHEPRASSVSQAIGHERVAARHHVGANAARAPPFSA